MMDNSIVSEQENTNCIIFQAKRSDLIDLLKCIGIVSVVIGHALNTTNYYSPVIEYIRRFVYTYNIPIFFFVMGYLFKQYNFSAFALRLIKNQYIKFIIIGLILISLIPLWSYIGVINPISLNDVPHMLINIFSMRADFILMGAMWFCTFYVVADIFFYVISHLSEKNLIVACIACGIFGLLLKLYSIRNIYHINDALLIQPIILIGYEWKRHESHIKKQLEQSGGGIA